MPIRPYAARPHKVARLRTPSEILEIAKTMQNMIYDQGVTVEDLMKSLDIVIELNKPKEAK